MNDILTPKDLEIFLNKLRNTTEQFNISFSAVGKFDNKQVDLLHEIEFEDNYNKRIKLVTQLHRLRNDRRQAKDMVQVCEVVTDFTEQNKAFIKKLEQLLGKMRKNEECIKNRTYRKRCKDGE